MQLEFSTNANFKQIYAIFPSQNQIMKKLLLLLLPLVPMQLMAQQSEFYGNFTPTVSHLVPVSPKDAQPNKVVINQTLKGVKKPL